MSHTRLDEVINDINDTLNCCKYDFILADEFISYEKLKLIVYSSYTRIHAIDVKSHSHDDNDVIRQIKMQINTYMNEIWEKIHHFPTSWSQVISTSIYPELYSIAAAIYASSLYELGSNDDISNRLRQYIDAIASCDAGILMGRRQPLLLSLTTMNIHAYLVAMASDYHVSCTQLESELMLVHDTPQTKSRKRSLPVPCNVMRLPYGSYQDNNSNSRVVTVNNPSLPHFYEQFMLQSTPVVISHAMEEWPAISSHDSCWNDVMNIGKVAGYRIVPVELGKSYLAPDAGQRLMPLHLFIDEYLLHHTSSLSSSSSSSSMMHDQTAIAYLAQHELFSQIPALRSAIITPEYCAMLTADDEDSDDVIENIWMGPAGTVSPLHHDPYHNILAQVVGYKYVRLYNSTESHRLYPRQGIMSNNSEVDLLECGNAAYDARYPLVHDAKFQEIILKSGDMLFIPRWCWHFVAAINYETVQQLEGLRSDGVCTTNAASFDDFSVSVSFWWGKRICKEEIINKR